MKDEIC